MSRKFITSVTLFLTVLSLTAGCMAVVRPRIITFTNSADALTLDLHLQDFLSSIEYRAEATQQAYSNDLRKLRDFLASDIGVEPSTVMFHEVTRSGIEKFREHGLHSESPSTVQRRLDTVKAFCRFIKDKYHTSDRAAGVRGVVLPEADFLGLSDEQHGRFLEYLETADPRTRFLAHFFLETGFRDISVRSATFGNLKPDWSWFVDVRQKGRRPISIPASKTFRQELSRYLPHRGSYPTEGAWPIVVSSYGATENDPASYVISQKTLWRSMHDAMVAVGVPDELAHPHTLRHTFARKLLRRLSHRMAPLEALKVVSRALGHSDIKHTLKYLGVEKTVLEEAMEA